MKRYGPMGSQHTWDELERPDGQFYRASEVDSLFKKLVDAYDNGIIMSSDKAGYINVILEIKATLGKEGGQS